jgi:hypothetical protein
MIIDKPDSKVPPEEEEEAARSVYTDGPAVGGSKIRAV